MYSEYSILFHFSKHVINRFTHDYLNAVTLSHIYGVYKSGNEQMNIHITVIVIPGILIAYMRKYNEGRIGSLSM